MTNSTVILARRVAVGDRIALEPILALLDQHLEEPFGPEDHAAAAAGPALVLSVARSDLAWPQDVSQRLMLIETDTLSVAVPERALVVRSRAEAGTPPKVDRTFTIPTDQI